MFSFSSFCWLLILWQRAREESQYLQNECQAFSHQRDKCRQDLTQLMVELDRVRALIQSEERQHQTALQEESKQRVAVLEAAEKRTHGDFGAAEATN